MSLLASQRAFHAQIAADDDAPPPTSPGMAIYRDAYRGRLLAALETSFARTRRWVGEHAFAAAACHFIIANPPTGWTLDDYGADFPEALAALFAQDPEVSELAWLEWHLQQAFAARDGAALDPAALAQAGYSDDDWANLLFTMAPGFALRSIAFDCPALWEALADDAPASSAARRISGASLLVWRSGLQPRYRIAEPDELQVITLIAGGAALGHAAQAADPARLGEWLARWLGEGLFAGAAVRGDQARSTSSRCANTAACSSVLARRMQRT